MTDLEAYGRACALWGAGGAAWRIAPSRVVVGRWVPLGEVKETHDRAVRLRTHRQGCEVMGEAPTWEEAFAIAEVDRSR